MPTMNLMNEFDRAAAAVTGIISAVRPDQFGLPTDFTPDLHRLAAFLGRESVHAK
jgi:hypothetical protein